MPDRISEKKKGLLEIGVIVIGLSLGVVTFDKNSEAIFDKMSEVYDTYVGYQIKKGIKSIKQLYLHKGVYGD